MKTLTHFLRTFLFFWGVLAITACAQLGVSPADTFNKKLAAGYVTVQTVGDGIEILARAGKITKSEGQNLLNSNKDALAGLDAAAVLARTSPVLAQDRLALTITALTVLQSYIATKQGTIK